MGGMSWPPFDDTVSMAPACSGVYPLFFIIGMVKLPVMVILATVLPVTVPKRELPNKATIAGPERSFEPIQRPNPMINRVPPNASSTPPKKINKNR